LVPVNAPAWPIVPSRTTPANAVVEQKWNARDMVHTEKNLFILISN